MTWIAHSDVRIEDDLMEPSCDSTSAVRTTKRSIRKSGFKAAQYRIMRDGKSADISQHSSYGKK